MTSSLGQFFATGAACSLSSTVVDEVIATANLVGVLVVVVAKSGCSRAAREPRTKMMAEFVAVFLSSVDCLSQKLRS